MGKISVNKKSLNFEYLRATSHSFLAEYDQKIVLKNITDGNSKSFKLPPNVGGQTEIYVYIDSFRAKEYLIFVEDFYTAFDPKNLKVVEGDYNFNISKTKKYIGKIYFERNIRKLVFLDSRETVEPKFEHVDSWSILIGFEP